MPQRTTRIDDRSVTTVSQVSHDNQYAES